MLTGSLLLALVTAAPSTGPLTLALPGLNGVNLAAGEADLHAEVLAQMLVRHGLKVMTGRDLAAVIGMERQKQLLTCTDSACLTELVGSLGADGIVVGDIGHLGDEYAINVKVLSSKSATPLAMYTLRAPDAKHVPRALDVCAWEMASQLSAALLRPDLAPKTPRPSLEDGPPPLALSPKLWAILPAAVAVAGAFVGVTNQGLAQQKYDAMAVAQDAASLAVQRDEGKRAQDLARLGYVAAGLGALGTAAVLVFVGNDARVTPSAFFAPSGGGVVLTGSLP